MRKDVKFGATVGGILLATIVVYVIVISSGGAGHQDNKPIANGEGAVTPVMPAGDATPSSGNVASTTGGATSGASSSLPPARLDKPATMPSGSSLASGSSLSSPADLTGGATTMPSQASAPGPKFDWNDALNSGSIPMIAAGAPEHTETPTIARGSSAAPRIDGDPGSASQSAPVGPPSMSARAPMMIDQLPSTRPDVATAVDPAPADSAPATPRTPTSVSPIVPATTPRTHVIASGESLWSIAAAVYGDAKYYIRIVEANPDIDPKHLKVGKTLTIPPLSDMDRKSRMPAASNTVNAANTASPAEKIDAKTQYKVVSGDSLEQIAKRLYGKADMKEKIYETNKALIGPNENTLKVGWVLKLPEAPTLP